MTKINAGPMPRQKAPMPSFARSLREVSMKPSFLMTAVWDESEEPPIVRTACDVWTTHIGLLMTVVANPVLADELGEFEMLQT